jgi:hypothetical protein
VEKSNTFRRYLYLLFHADTAFAELGLSFIYVGWATALLLTSPTLISTSPAYKAFYEVIPQQGWGLIFLVAGVTKFVGVLLSKRSLRTLGALLGTGIWAFAAWAFLNTSGFTPGASMSLTFGCTCFLIGTRQFRMAVDAWLAHRPAPTEDRPQSRQQPEESPDD